MEKIEDNNTIKEDNKTLGIHLIDQVFFEKYKLVKKIGEGSFGMIFQAQSPEGDFALKFEKKRPGKRILLKKESQIMIYLKGKGIPDIKFYSDEENFSIMVMELLGNSLETLLRESDDKKMSLKTICLLGIEIVSILKYIHDKHIIHRDIKPDNFAIGYEDPCQIYLLDFGLAKKYRSSKTLKHNPMVEHSKLTGTARYASINALKGLEQSRRDDLEALGYVLNYLLKGKLPWQGITAKTKEEKYEKIMNNKLKTSAEKLFKNEPKELADYIKYCRNLGYEDDPDYSYLTGLFKTVITKRLKEKIDYIYDWVTDYAAQSHIQMVKEAKKKPKNENNSNDNDLNRITTVDSKNYIGTEENDTKIEVNKNNQLSHYDAVIDELKNEDKENENDENIENKEKELKHGQCCLLI